ncbi:MAG: O-antigen ligase family protein [candidate division Zixibacteria bacterium]|nr:O-antigen ligase family protein [candidate division Zixibacteria bacterium]
MEDIFLFQQALLQMIYYLVFGLWFIWAMAKQIDVSALKDRIVLMLLMFFCLEVVSSLVTSGFGAIALLSDYAYSNIREQAVSLVMFLLAASLCKNKQGVINIIHVIFTGSLVVMGIGCLEKMIGYNIFSTKGVTPFTAIMSTYMDQSFLGRYLMFLILLFLPFVIFDGWNKTVSLFTTISAAILLIFTRSVSGLLSLGVGLFMLILQSKYYLKKTAENYRKPKFAWSMFVFVVLIVLAITSQPEMIKSVNEYFMSAAFKLGTFQSSARYNMDMTALEMFKKNPLFGVGFGNYPKYFNEYNQRINVWGLGGEPIIHNSLLSVAAELGIVGLIFILYFYGYFIKIALFDARKIKDDFMRKAQLSLGIIWIVMIVNSWVYFKFFEDPKIWFAMGLAYAIRRNYLDEKED